MLAEQFYIMRKFFKSQSFFSYIVIEIVLDAPLVSCIFFRWDAPKIGTDNWGKPKEKYYWCFMGKCSQSTVENCSRR